MYKRTFSCPHCLNKLQLPAKAEISVLQGKVYYCPIEQCGYWMVVLHLEYGQALTVVKLDVDLMVSDEVSVKDKQDYILNEVIAELVKQEIDFIETQIDDELIEVEITVNKGHFRNRPITNEEVKEFLEIGLVKICGRTPFDT